MGKQLKIGTQFPMRPAMATIDLAADDGINNDPAPVAWTAGSTRLTARIREKFLDDDDDITIDAGNNIFLRPGVWEVAFHPHVDNGETDVQDLEMAITDDAGSVVHLESTPMTIAASGSLCPTLVVLLHLTTSQIVAIRAVQSSTGISGELVLSKDHVATVRKIGNVNES